MDNPLSGFISLDQKQSYLPILSQLNATIRSQYCTENSIRAEVFLTESFNHFILKQI